MNKFIIILVLILQQEFVLAQNWIEFGVGMHIDKFSGEQFTYDSLAIAPKKSADNPRVTFLLFYNQKVGRKLNVEIGIKSYTSFNTYFAGQLHPDFGYIKKVGFARSFTINTPVNITYNLHNGIYFIAGISSSISMIKKRKDMHFNDIPAVDNLYNSPKSTFKPVFMNYGLGVGYRFKRINLNYYFTKSISEIARPFEYLGNRHILFNGIESHHFDLTYLFLIRKNEKKD